MSTRRHIVGRTALRRDAIRLRKAAALLTLVVVQSAGCDADPGYRGRTSNEWIAQLHNPNVAAKVDAAAALAEILRIQPGSPRVTGALVQALGDSTDDVRLAAGDALAQPGVDASDAVRGLITVAYDSAHADVRASAMRLLARVIRGMRGPEAEQHLEAVVRVWATGLTDPSVQVRSASADALERAGDALRAHSAVLVEGLRRLAREPEARLRARAVSILPSVSMPDSLAQAMYGEAFRDPVNAVREAAIVAAGRPARADVFLLNAITAALDDSASTVRRTAAVTLGTIDVSLLGTTQSALRHAQADADSAVRTEATHALQRFHQRGGVDAPPREPTAEERCRDLPRRTRGC